MLDEARRECILEAAVRAFRRLGFKKTSIDDVASEAKVGKGTVYMAVRSKDELYLKAVARELDAWIEERRAVAADFSTEGLGRLVMSEIDSARRRDLVHPVITGRIADTVPGVDVAALRHHARENLRAALTLGRDVGRFAPELDPDVGAQILQGLEVQALTAHPAAEPPADHPTRPLPDTIARLVAALVVGLVPHR